MKQVKSWLDRFEQTTTYAQYMAYNAMSSTDKKALWDEWNVYYQKVRETKIGRLLQKQREAFIKSDFGKALEIAKWTKDNSDTVLSDAPTKPIFSDPYEIIHNSADYVQKRSEYNQLKQFFSDIGEGNDVLL